MGSWEENATWDFQDEAHNQWVQWKYGKENRAKLKEDYQNKTKMVEKSKTLPDGKPNPHLPRMQLEADLAQTRYDMAYLVDRNQELENKMEILVQLFDRVSILEGAYSHIKTVAEVAKIDYGLISQGLREIKEIKDLKAKSQPQPTKEHVE